MSKKFKIWVSIAIFALALIVRLSYVGFLYFDEVSDGSGGKKRAYLVQSGGDMPTYIVPAYYLYNKGEFKYSSAMAKKIGINDKPNTINYGIDPSGKNPNWGFIYNDEFSYIRRLPVYPCFLTIIPAFPSYESGVMAAIILQSIIDSFTALMIFSITLLVIKKDTFFALIPACLYIVNFSAISNVPKLLTDILFAFFFALTVLLFLKYLAKGYERGAWKWLAFALIAASLSLMTRSVGLLLFGSMGLIVGLRGIFYAIKNKQKFCFLFDWSAGVIIACVLLLVYGSWTYRNYAKTGEVCFEPTYAINRAFCVAVPYLAKEKNISLIDSEYLVYQKCVEIGAKQGLDFEKVPLNQYPSVLNEVADEILKNSGLYAFKGSFIIGPVYLLYPDFDFFYRIGVYESNTSDFNRVEVSSYGGKMLYTLKRIWDMPIVFFSLVVLYMCTLCLTLLSFPVMIIAMIVRKLRPTFASVFVMLLSFIQLFSIGVVAGPRYSIPLIPYFTVLALWVYYTLFMRKAGNKIKSE